MWTIKLSASNSRELMGIRAIPTFQIIVDGVKVAELVGADQQKLRTWLPEHFGGK
ncbi:uncharacterized protein PGTG_07300 [Puccinia graminis f. sp. tritici CRL 75-36-700-3]|uniref:Thioredoxin domain-containing protein n=1 Tax=Puccinia graminis f. sp. tritici (strain CRL 75-36-700-3 / race SCCL) TaxID=418459 RepID=E3K998_PUCGT|nr:uncharacterized protein PGTG_07300 [Puccinia graminis f. sp. tritici CRL 75-36-700-3]EFP81048.2 hypothetical protein PGTG_07300 [Puccinia graminis f. sp. tritici CRL 75-36-700-3]